MDTATTVKVSAIDAETNALVDAITEKHAATSQAVAIRWANLVKEVYDKQGWSVPFPCHGTKAFTSHFKRFYNRTRRKLEERGLVVCGVSERLFAKLKHGDFPARNDDPLTDVFYEDCVPRSSRPKSGFVVFPRGEHGQEVNHPLAIASHRAQVLQAKGSLSSAVHRTWHAHESLVLDDTTTNKIVPPVIAAIEQKPAPPLLNGFID